MHAPSGPDAELARALAAWRWRIDALGCPPLVSIDTAVSVINAAREAKPHH